MIKAAILFLAACSYHPGTFHDREGPWPGTRVSTGCLDLAVASSEAIEGKPVIAYSVGNRCDHRIDVDLGRLRVVARDARGAETPLVAYDPRGELVPTAMNALWSGHAQIAYQGAPAELAAICVEVDERWVCIAKEKV